MNLHMPGSHQSRHKKRTDLLTDQGKAMIGLGSHKNLFINFVLYFPHFTLAATSGVDVGSDDKGDILREEKDKTCSLFLFKNFGDSNKKCEITLT